jgi:hypothetical protein
VRYIWSDSEIAALEAAYSAASSNEDLDLDALALSLGRSRHSVALKASRLGLTDRSRKGVEVRKDAPKYTTPEELREAQSAMVRARIQANGHPRHMLGKVHTLAARSKMASSTKAAWDRLSPDEQFDRITAAMKGKLAKYGKVAPPPAKPRGSWKAGWREIGGKRNYYRSLWEANYARYLQWLKEHEPETFWFEAIRRGVRSYLPDFRVTENNQSSTLHEVKGWMDSRSRTTLRRMAKYHPTERIILIREAQYREIARKVSGMIAGWESGREPAP